MGRKTLANLKKGWGGIDETRVAKIRINVGIERCVHGGSLILLCVTEIFHYKKFS